MSFGEGRSRIRKGHADANFAVVRRMACDGKIIPMVLRGESVPMDLGRSRRVVDKRLRRALIARDRHCAWPRCRRRARHCEAHHITSWLDLGPTDLANLVLLCRMHHRIAEHSDWVIRMNNGIPEFIPPAYLDPLQQPLRNTIMPAA